VAGLAAPGAAVQSKPTVVIVSPEDGSYVSGPTAFQVRVEPAGVEVRSITLFVDGREVCTLDHAPFECVFDAGLKVIEHTLRAVAVTADGRRPARAIRTKGVAYTDNVDVDVVHITASVIDGSGHFVREIPRESFRVTERKVPQTITHFASENVPLDIIVAVDVSGSMADAMPQVKSAVKTFISALRPPDQVTLIGFNDNVFTLARPTENLAARLRAVDLMAPWGGTALYDMIVLTLDKMGRQASRRVLVVFTDGEDLNSSTAIDATERRLETSDAVLYAIGQGRAPKVKDLKTVLERLSQKSGGRAFFEDLDKLDRVFASILEELSNQYLLGFVPRDATRDGTWRPLTVEIPGRNYRIRAKQGYRLERR
jgi:VWFA-related protein